MILDVAYQSQEPLENGEVRKWCGMACLWMVLSFYLKSQAPTVEELLEQYGSEFEQAGFRHQDLLNIARNYGFRGFRKSWWVLPGAQLVIDKFKEEGETKQDIKGWEETNIKESLYTLQNLINHQIPVILSVSQEFSPSNSTHLVVLVGWEEDTLVIHDPYKKGANFKTSKEEFKKYFLKQAIIVLPQQED